MLRMMVAMVGLTAMLFIVGSARAQVSIQGGVRIVFGDDEQQTIKNYYGKEIIEKALEQSEKEGKGKGKGKGKGRKGLPPGLAKKAKLPPGIEKQLERNGTLPQGLEKEMEPLPRELEERLKPLPPDHVRVVVGTDIIVMNKTTQKILDIVRDVAQLHHDITK
ncbi:MAG: hypothetical protein HY581_05940 [Nitrospirae bacterium]|nr:hypothetical protein [Nitrospirota bacterium]